MNKFTKFPNFLLTTIIAVLLIPQVALGQVSSSNSNQTNSNRTKNLAQDPPTLKLEKEDHIQDALKLHEAMSQVVLKIHRCQTSGNESLESCKCQANSEIDSVNKLYRTTIEKHPNWKNQKIKYPTQNSSPNVTGTVTINFSKSLKSNKYFSQPCQ